MTKTATPSSKGFDGDGFYRALEATVRSRTKSWKQVAMETGVSTSTLARMGQGAKPDAASLAVLSAWAGLNPSDFVDSPHKVARPEPMVQITTLLRTDPNLNPQAAAAMEAILMTAYNSLRVDTKKK
jgi:hypothetical protein